MQATIKTISPKMLIGKKLVMDFANNRTVELWRSYMPQRKEIKNTLGTELISMQVYPGDFDFSAFNPHAAFEKWAATEVSGFDDLPPGMECFTLPGGMYAVFIHKGSASEGPKTFAYIFGTWLPASDYELDQRPHFELLGEKYKNEDPSSEEEIWIPVKSRKK